ncbi:MAG: hypothetical protein HY799_08105 [Nitrosomonadales bacterium]|nr:hypothetical protein [Nitrosomonadales bacterium]
MGQSIETKSNEKQNDVSKCRVRRLENGMGICLMKPQCEYALPFGNVCGHPLASQIAAGEHPPH